MASDGDIRVLLVLDIVLSAAFAAVVLWGLQFLDLATLDLRSLALWTAGIATLTYVVVLR